MNHDTNEAVQIADDEFKPLLPIEMVEDIFSRLLVKFLLQLQCMCKSWKSLISSPKFAKRHLSMTKAYEHHHHLMLTTTESNNLVLWDSHITSIFTTLSPSKPLAFSDILNTHRSRVCSCHGILCFTIQDSYPVLWNPSTRKHNVIPPVENLFSQRPPDYPTKSRLRPKSIIQCNTYSFGHDTSTHKYKIVALSYIRNPCTPKVCIYTLGSDPTDSSWRLTNDFPGHGYISEPGVSVSGTLNWKVSGGIVSLDLATESYQQLLLPPPATGEGLVLTLGVLRDCLCLCASNKDMNEVDVWMMTESWNVLYNIPYIQDQRPHTKVLYVTEEEKLLMYYHDSLKLAVSDSGNVPGYMSELQHNSSTDPIVYVESLISPWP